MTRAQEDERRRERRGNSGPDPVEPHICWLKIRRQLLLQWMPRVLKCHTQQHRQLRRLSMCHVCLNHKSHLRMAHGHYFAADYYLGKANEDLLEHSTFSLEI